MKKWVIGWALLVIGLPLVIGWVYLYNAAGCRSVQSDLGLPIQVLLSRYGNDYSKQHATKEWFLLEDFIVLSGQDLSEYDDFECYIWDKFGYQQIVITGKRNGVSVCLLSDRHGNGIVH